MTACWVDLSEKTALFPAWTMNEGGQLALLDDLGYAAELIALDLTRHLNFLMHHHYDRLKCVCPYLDETREPGSFYFEVV